MDDTFRKVEEHLRKMVPLRRLGMPITLDTELYLDRGLYGDDIVFDLVLWAEREFGVEGSFRLTDHAPGEHLLPPGLWRSLRKLTGTKEREYKSLKVRDVVTAIETKRWPD
jgi:hypothetical protein